MRVLNQAPLPLQFSILSYPGRNVKIATTVSRVFAVCGIRRCSAGTTVDDGEGDGDNEGLSTGAIVGIIAAVLGLIGGGLILKFNNNNCFTINKTSVQVHNTEALSTQ